MALLCEIYNENDENISIFRAHQFNLRWNSANNIQVEGGKYHVVPYKQVQLCEQKM